MYLYIYIERERLFGIVTVTFVDLRVSNLSWKYTLDHVRSVRNTLQNGNRVPVVSVFIKVRDWVKAKLLYDVCENLKPHTCAIKFVKFTYNFAVPPPSKGKDIGKHDRLPMACQTIQTWHQHQKHPNWICLQIFWLILSVPNSLLN